MIGGGGFIVRVSLLVLFLGEDILLAVACLRLLFKSIAELSFLLGLCLSGTQLLEDTLFFVFALFTVHFVHHFLSDLIFETEFGFLILIDGHSKVFFVEDSVFFLQPRVVGPNIVDERAELALKLSVDHVAIAVLAVRRRAFVIIATGQFPLRELVLHVGQGLAPLLVLILVRELFVYSPLWLVAVLYFFVFKK